MKIGILTYYGDLNCGTNLQAYATMQAVRQVFNNDEVEIIPFHGFTPPDVKPYLSQCTPISLFRDFKRIIGYKKFVKEQLGVINDNIIKNPQKGLDFIRERRYDRIYVGADTLLELDRIPKGYDGLSAYWLGPSVPAKQYLASASAKNVTFEHLTPKQKREMQSCVDNYSGVTVRDKSTCRLLGNFMDYKNIQLVPDPTFTLQINYTYTENYIARRNLDLTNTICLHTLRDDYWASEFANLARAKGYKVASFRPARWADIELNDMTPFEQLGIYSKFKCFITHRFHDTVFCLKNSCPVISYPVSTAYTDENGDSKYSTLLDHFGLSDLCLLPNRHDIQPVNLMSRMEKVITEYKKRSTLIENVIGDIKKQYIEAVIMTSNYD